MASVLQAVFVDSQKHPTNVWPLGNLTLFNDVMNTQDIQHDDNRICYTFVDGPHGLPYSILDLSDSVSTGLDVTLSGTAPLRDLTFSLYIYTNNDLADITGTIFHYQLEDREFIRVRMLANTFLVSFRDEYGMSAGMMYLTDFLTSHTWSHVIICREFATGRITIYKDGVEMYNMDDDFSNVISFPRDGKLRLGMSQNTEEPDVFDGNIACVQFYDIQASVDMPVGLLEYCKPETWNNHFSCKYTLN